MTEAAKQARRKYSREWQRNHKDKVKQYNNRYWEKKANADANNTGKAARADHEELKS